MALGLMVGTVVSIAGGIAILTLAPFKPPTATGDLSSSGGEIGGPFQLMDDQGRPFSDRMLRGHFALLYFGYTSCPDVCPTTLTTLIGALDQLGTRAETVLPVFVTIDPQRDTPAVLHRYLAAFSPRLVGLRGTPDQIAKIAQIYRVYYAIHRTGSGADDYTMDHSSMMYLIGPDGKFITPLQADGAVSALRSAIEDHLS